MKRLTASFLFLSALSAPAFAETPVERQMHSWEYVQQVANPVQPEAPVAEHRDQRAYYHHDAEKHKGKHHDGMKHHHHHKDGAKHEGKHHAGAKHHHHHHHKDAAKTDAAPAKDQPKQ